MTGWIIRDAGRKMLNINRTIVELVQILQIWWTHPHPAENPKRFERPGELYLPLPGAGKEKVEIHRPKKEVNPRYHVPE
jgi:hypothetical protein